MKTYLEGLTAAREIAIEPEPRLTLQEREIEMMDGYRDGFKDDRESFPPSLRNRSESYCHGWLNGRDDRLKFPRARAPDLLKLAEQAILADSSQWNPS